MSYYGVADRHLLGTAGPQTDIDVYANVTRYMSPAGIRYLRSYISDQTRNVEHLDQAAFLAFADIHPSPPGIQSLLRGGAAQRLRFDTPFRVTAYSSTIDAHVGLNDDGSAMVVTGSCRVSILAHRGTTPVYVVLQRPTWTYYVQAEPSREYPVGVVGWRSTTGSTVRQRT